LSPAGGKFGNFSTDFDLKAQSKPQQTTNKPDSIRCLLTPGSGIRGRVKNQEPDPESGSGMNNSDNISESLETIFWVKILKFFDTDPGWKNLDPGWKKFTTKIAYL
jgi:hypothetical protein